MSEQCSDTSSLPEKRQILREYRLSELKLMNIRLLKEYQTLKSENEELRKALLFAQTMVDKGIQVRIGDQWPVLAELLPITSDRIKYALNYRNLST